jgi:hypothetical protein
MFLEEEEIDIVVYFDPSLLDVECPGQADFVFDTIQECDIDCRLQLYEHII